jgi:hypothetical protein
VLSLLSCAHSPTFLLDKALKKLGIESLSLSVIKAMYDRPIINMMLNGEKLKAFSLKPGMRQGCPLPPCLINVVLKFLTRAVRQET